MKNLKIRLTFTEDCLGTASADKEIHSRFIASNAPDAPSRAEEVAAVGAEEVEERSMTVFPRDEEGNPIFWDYQIKGFFKDSCSALQRMKGEEIAKESCKLKAYKKIIDGAIFVFPRKIKINMAGDIGDLQRPLRGQTAQGERIALAHSETIPAGSTIEIKIMVPDIYEKVVMEWLEYGQLKGLGQWRNASFGRFTYEILDDNKKTDEVSTENDGKAET